MNDFIMPMKTYLFCKTAKATIQDLKDSSQALIILTFKPSILINLTKILGILKTLPQ